MFDVIVVGARCAGSPLAMLLSRKGYKVLLVDKAHFPSDTISTHLVWHAALAQAKHWGLLERIRALGAPPIRAVCFDTGEFALTGSPPPLDGVDYALAPRRTLLDKLLVDAAVEAGAEWRPDFCVNGLTAERGQVNGISGRTSRGATVVENAVLVAGADGPHSLVAHCVRAPRYDERPSTACAYYAYWRGGPPVRDFEIWMRSGWGGAALPTNDGLTCVVASWRDSRAGPPASPREGYRRFLAGIPRTEEFLKGAEQVEPLAGMYALPGFFRKAWGKGWVLAGDARYHKHPLSAQGITDAFADAGRLAAAIDDGLAGSRALHESLADYERERREAVLPMYRSTCERARLEPPAPETTALLQALRHNQPETDRFFGTDAGTVAMDEFFAPENLERILHGRPSLAAGRG